jgi:23S rRNA (adenine2503-C2)-methyltransferase
LRHIAVERRLFARNTSKDQMKAPAQLSLYDLTLAELEATLVEWGAPKYRAKQIYGWAYDRLVESYDEMTNLPAALRARLAEELPFVPYRNVREVTLTEPEGETIKTLFATADERHVEAVLMFYPDRATACVSCQVGCPIRCTFCATGLGGLERNLTTGEIVAQVVTLARRARAAGRPLTNVVMMGMGEPLANYGPTFKFIGIINDAAGLNFGARRITVSTAGIVTGIDKLATEPQAVNLAVSLHAPTDELRSTLVPLNKRWPVDELLAACHRYVNSTHRRVTFEYILIKDLNDAPEQAEILARKLGKLLCHVNLIPCNPTPAGPFQPPSHAAIDRFAAILRTAGIATTVRWSRGVSIAAACGQLRAEEEGRGERPLIPVRRTVAATTATPA